MNSVVRILILLLPITLVGCSYIPKSFFSQNHDRNYLSARSVPPLRVPPGIKTDSFHTAYPVSDRQYPVSTEDVSVVPPGL